LFPCHDNLPFRHRKSEQGSPAFLRRRHTFAKIFFHLVLRCKPEMKCEVNASQPDQYAAQVHGLASTSFLILHLPSQSLRLACQVPRLASQILRVANQGQAQVCFPV
jgi:hypothetical protein